MSKMSGWPKDHTCNLCDKAMTECCPDGNCRECHVSLSFEECCDGSWNEKRRQSILKDRKSK